MKLLNVYFGCALAYSPEEFKKDIYAAKDKLREIPWIKLFEFCTPDPGKQQSDLPAEDIYDNDINIGVGNAHVVIGDLTFPSTGLGGELMAGMCVSKVRVMMFARETIKNERGGEEKTIVSKVWLGAPHHNHNASFEWYKNSVHEKIEFIIAELSRIHQIIQLD